MIDVACQCGRVSHSDEQHIGKHLRCPNCGEPVLIMDAARAMARPPKTTLRTHSSQPRAKRLRRLRPLHTWTILVGAIVTTALLVSEVCTLRKGAIRSMINSKPLTRILPHPKPERLPKRNRMTLAIGIQCKDGLLLATDTRLSYSYGPVAEGQKLTGFDTEHGTFAIAQSSDDIHAANMRSGVLPHQRKASRLWKSSGIARSATNRLCS